jgi:hypothetical protein
MRKVPLLLTPKMPRGTMGTAIDLSSRTRSEDPDTATHTVDLGDGTVFADHPNVSNLYPRPFAGGHTSFSFDSVDDCHYQYMLDEALSPHPRSNLCVKLCATLRAGCGPGTVCVWVSIVLMCIVPMAVILCMAVAATECDDAGDGGGGSGSGSNATATTGVA